MDFQLSEEQTLIQQSTKEFADDFSNMSVQEALAALAEIDFLGIFVSEEEGGAGGDFVSYIVALEEVAKKSPSAALAYSLPLYPSHVCYSKIWLINFERKISFCFM